MKLQWKLRVLFTFLMLVICASGTTQTLTVELDNPTGNLITGRLIVDGLPGGADYKGCLVWLDLVTTDAVLDVDIFNRYVKRIRNIFIASMEYY